VTPEMSTINQIAIFWHLVDSKAHKERVLWIDFQISYARNAFFQNLLVLSKS
jgi:hypothetical protein